MNEPEEDNESIDLYEHSDEWVAEKNDLTRIFQQLTSQIRDLKLKYIRGPLFDKKELAGRIKD